MKRLEQQKEETVKINYLVETCLLTHGLRSVSNEEVKEAWKNVPAKFAWIDEGEIQVGTMEEYLPFRARRIKLRVNCFNLDEMLEKRVPGALTASGTMEVCRRLGVSVAVTCGIGGLGVIPGEALCPDLSALADLPVSLIATSPKDMINIRDTFAWLREHEVRILGYQSEYCTGYVFCSAKEKVDGLFDEKTKISKGRQLLLNPIEEALRIEDKSILERAVEEGYAAAERGEYFHPAANAALDRQTDGKASYLQLESIVKNAILAGKLC